MKVFIAADHAGFELKEKLILYLKEQGHEVEDKGAYKYDKEDDYPDFMKSVAEEVSKDPNNAYGIVIGGGGQGEAIVSNRFAGVRTAVFYGPRLTAEAVDISGRKSNDPYEIVRLAREHNDANILSLAARFVSIDETKTAVKVFLETQFSGEERHVRRINKIDEK